MKEIDQEEDYRENVVTINEEQVLVEDLEEGELSPLNHHRFKDMKECTFKDRQSSLVLGSSFSNLEFSDLKKTPMDYSSLQHSIYNFLDLD